MSYTFSNVTSDHTIQAVFTNMVNINVGGFTSGLVLGVTIGQGSEQTISSSAAFNNLTVPTGSYIAIRVITNPTGVRYVSANWSFSDESETIFDPAVGDYSQGLPVTITVPATVATGVPTANLTIYLFSRSLHTITVTQPTGGTISPGTTIVEEGDDQSFTITPSTGYRFNYWMIDGQRVDTPGSTSYTFSEVVADHTITAVLTKITFYITASASAGGTISPSGTVSVEYGASQTFTASPNSGYRLSHWVVDGNTQPDQ